jgi:hypothetical protein
MHRNGHFPFFFVAPVVEDTTAIIDFAQFGGGFGGETGSLQEACFSYTTMREKTDISNRSGLIFFHVSSIEVLLIKFENLEKKLIFSRICRGISEKGKIY